MNKKKILYLVAAVAFDIAAICAFIAYFTGNEDSNSSIVMGMTFAILSVPMYVLFSRENKK
jgi:hypothetical protein